MKGDQKIRISEFEIRDVNVTKSSRSFIIHPYLLVVHKGIHEQPLIDELLPLGLLISQVSVVVIGDNDAV